MAPGSISLDINCKTWEGASEGIRKVKGDWNYVVTHCRKGQTRK